MTATRCASARTAAGLLAALCVLLCQSLAWAEVPVPELKARVTDLTGTLSAQQSAALEQKLRAFEERKGAQIAVLLLPTTDGEDITEFGVRLEEVWKLGRKGIDDSAIVIVAKNDRRMRIEVGYGLEGVLTDAASRRIIDEIMAPRFRAGDFAGGIDAATDRIIGLVDGEPLPEPTPRWSGSPSIADYLPLLAFAVIPAVVLRRLFGRIGGSFATGTLVGGVAWLITQLIGAALLFGLLGFVGALVLGFTGGPRGWSSHRRGGSYGGWGGGGGGFGGGGFGGGGFSGGGGGSGGGGASGGW